MINILIIDDEVDIIEVESRIVSRYFISNEIEDYTIDSAPNGKEAISMIDQKDYHLLFLDYMMPLSNGVDVLDHIRITNKDRYQPYVCMVTAMGTDENLVVFKNHKASSYVLKPFRIKTINLMLDTYIKPIIEESKNSQFEVDEFVDFDEFEDFDNIDFEVEISDDEKDTMNTNNLNHKQVSASEFLIDFENLEYILNDVNEIDELLSNLIDYLDLDTFEQYKIEINNTLSLYSVFLRSLSDFDDLANTLDLIKELINDIEIFNIEEKKQRFIIETIRAILNDISSWKESVFIQKDAVDVFYIGASNYNSYLQLRDLIKT